MSNDKRMRPQEIADIWRAWESVFGVGFRMVAIVGDNDDECDIEARGPKAKFIVAKNVPDDLSSLFLRAPDIAAAALGRWPGGEERGARNQRRPDLDGQGGRS